MIFDLYTKFANGTLKINPVKKEIEKFDRKVLTGKLVEIFNEMVSK